MGGADEIDRRVLSRVMKRFDPVWDLHRAERIGSGDLAVYRITVSSPDMETTWILKLTPESDTDRVSTEARLLALLSDTGISTPAVRGVVDEASGLPTPLVLLNDLPGRTITRDALAELDPDTLGTLAFQSGEMLATLHRIDAVDRFGHLGPSGSRYGGGVPSGDVDTIAVADARTSWRDRLTTDLASLVSGLQAGPFTEMAAEVERTLERGFQEMEGPFTPTLARIDHSIENLRVIGDRIVGVLDWEFTLAATPGYDLEHVTWSLAGGPYLYGTDLRDRRTLVRDRLVAGYTDAGGPGDIDRFRANRACYAALITARAMRLLGSWYDQFDFPRPQTAAADDLRTTFDEYDTV